MHKSDFFFASDLPETRRDEILQWVNSLPSDNQKMIEELREDSAEEAHYYATEIEDS